MTQQPIIIRHLNQQPYQPVWQAMQAFTQHRTEDTPDEIWLTEHPPTYTLGQAGKAEYVLDPKHIPVIKTDRGGQVTYHGPGQQIFYVLLNLKRHQLGVRGLVNLLEEAVIDLLATYHVPAQRIAQAPGVYVAQKKIAALGLRIRRHCSYHGLSVNINMDLTPFQGIHPCGHAGLEVTQTCDLGITESQQTLAQKLCKLLANLLNSKIVFVNHTPTDLCTKL